MSASGAPGGLGTYIVPEDHSNHEPDHVRYVRVEDPRYPSLNLREGRVVGEKTWRGLVSTVCVHVRGEGWGLLNKASGPFLFSFLAAPCWLLGSFLAGQLTRVPFETDVRALRTFEFSTITKKLSLSFCAFSVIHVRTSQGQCLTPDFIYGPIFAPDHLDPSHRPEDFDLPRPTGPRAHARSSVRSNRTCVIPSMSILAQRGSLDPFLVRRIKGRREKKRNY
jgi:hypothetical protein